MDATFGLESFCRGEKDGLLSVKKVIVVGGRYRLSIDYVYLLGSEI